MNSYSTDGFIWHNCYFFQKSWYIIMYDLMGVIQSVFSGQMIRKYFSRSCIVLLPKVSYPKKLFESNL